MQCIFCHLYVNLCTYCILYVKYLSVSVLSRCEYLVVAVLIHCVHINVASLPSVDIFMVPMGP